MPPSESASADAMRDVPLLAPLTPDQRQVLASSARVCTFRKGEDIFLEGDAVQGFYILLEGLVKIFHIAADGKELVLHLIRPTVTFGEVPVFKGGAGKAMGTWPASAAAVQPSRALFIPAEVFLGLIRQNPELALAMLAALAQRLYMFTRKVEAQGIREAPQRLAAYLLHRSRLGGGSRTLALDTARETLASMLGTARETLSRTLGALAEQGAISVQGRSVIIRDAELLQAIASGSKSLEK